MNFFLYKIHVMDAHLKLFLIFLLLLFYLVFLHLFSFFFFYSLSLENMNMLVYEIVKTAVLTLNQSTH